MSQLRQKGKFEKKKWNFFSNNYYSSDICIFQNRNRGKSFNRQHFSTSKVITRKIFTDAVLTKKSTHPLSANGVRCMH